MASIRESGASGSEPVSPPQWLMDAALARIHEGALPRELITRVLAGPGRGRTCSLCDYSIEQGDVGYAVAPGAAGEPDLQLHFHVCCYRAWVKACRALSRSYRRAPEITASFPDSKRPGT